MHTEVSFSQAGSPIYYANDDDGVSETLSDVFRPFNFRAAVTSSNLLKVNDSTAVGTLYLTLKATADVLNFSENAQAVSGAEIDANDTMLVQNIAVTDEAGNVIRGIQIVGDRGDVYPVNAPEPSGLLLALSSIGGAGLIVRHRRAGPDALFNVNRFDTFRHFIMHVVDDRIDRIGRLLIGRARRQQLAGFFGCSSAIRCNHSPPRLQAAYLTGTLSGGNWFDALGSFVPPPLGRSAGRTVGPSARMLRPNDGAAVVFGLVD